MKGSEAFLDSMAYLSPRQIDSLVPYPSMPLEAQVSQDTYPDVVYALIYNMALAFHLALYQLTFQI